MGNCCLPIRFRRTPSAGRPKNVTLLLLGLDNAGKTTIAKRLAGEPVDSVVPTVGFSVMVLRQKDCHVSIYDLGGGPQIRDIWPRYYADAHGVIFVTDATDTAKLEECRQVLERLLRSDHVAGKPVLLLANKQDLEGALDEIDVVERLNLEQLVNEQKCPTLVELCSALDFSKKVDIGIDNGYKWLVRSIVRDYPSLNNRVLSELAKQEEENKVHVIGRTRGNEDEEEEEERALTATEKRGSKIAEELRHANGVSVPRKKIRMGVGMRARIPGLVEEALESGKGGENVGGHLEEFSQQGAKATANSHSLEFFTWEKFQSDVELLNDVTSQSVKTFLVRPKSSGARLYGMGAERKRTHRRKPLRKVNKTGPSPFADISNDHKGQVQGDGRGNRGGEAGTKLRSSKTCRENVNPFVVGRKREEAFEVKEWGASRSTPSSRRNSTVVPGKRRRSLVNRRLVQTEEFSPGQEDVRREIVLDVTSLAN